MKFRAAGIVLALLACIPPANAASPGSRPREIQFIVDSEIMFTSKFEYSAAGDILKMASFQKSELIEYATYHYDEKGKAFRLETHDSAGRLLKTKRYLRDNAGRIHKERIYSPDGTLLEYRTILFSNNLIEKIESYRTDNTLSEFITFSYISGLLDRMNYHKADGSPTMVVTCMYGVNGTLVGHDVLMMDPERETATRMVYDDGPVTAQALELIFR